MQLSAKATTLDLKASLKRPIQWGLAVGLITALITIFMPNYYRSEAQLLPGESKGLGGNLGGLASAAAAFGVSVPGGDSNDANFVDVLNSRSMKEQLLKSEFHYHVRPWRFGQEQPKIGTLYDYLHPSNMDSAVRSVGNVFSASRDIKSKVISISAETRSPELSQMIVQQAAKLLEVFIQEKGRTHGGAKAAFSKARLSESRREMDEAEDALRCFLEGNRNYQSSSDPSVRLKGTRLESELRLRQQLVSSIAMSHEQALMEEKNDMPILNILDPGNLPIEKSRPARLMIIFITFVLFLIGSSIWFNREWLKVNLLQDE